MTSDPLTTGADARAAGIDCYPGPFPVGRYAAGLRENGGVYTHAATWAIAAAAKVKDAALVEKYRVA